MTKLDIVGISGKAASGKDFISRQFLNPLGYKQFSLAWHFKVWLVGKGQASHDEVFVTKPPHVRQLLQEEGTERGRLVYGDNVWCNTVAEWMRVLSENMGIDKFVIPDIRFPNEVEWVQSLGGRVWRIEAPTRSGNSSLSYAARMHVSETALDDYLGFDGIIRNDPHDTDVQEQIDALFAAEKNVVPNIAPTNAAFDAATLDFEAQMRQFQEKMRQGRGLY